MKRLLLLAFLLLTTVGSAQELELHFIDVGVRPVSHETVTGR